MILEPAEVTSGYSSRLDQAVVSRHNITSINLHFIVLGSDFIFHAMKHDIRGHVQGAIMKKRLCKRFAVASETQ